MYEDMEKEPVYSLSFDFIGGKDVMPLGGYYGPMPSNYSYNGNSLTDYITDDFYQMIADAGLNLIHHSYTDYATAPQLVRKNLELGEKYGVGSFVYDSNILNRIGDNKLTFSDVAKNLANYFDYRSFCGLYVVDEPRTSYYLAQDGVKNVEEYAKLLGLLKKNNIVGYINLNPLHNSGQLEPYEKYVKEVVDTCSPMFLSWDKYVFDEANREDVLTYFKNIDVIRSASQNGGVPFWAYVQAGGQWNDAAGPFNSKELYPTEGEMHWNVNTLLASGAKGIEYFPIIQPYYFAYSVEPEFDFERNGLFGAMGNKNRCY